MSRDLPEFPNLDHLKKQAKVLLRELQRGNPAAKLSEAQHLIARQYGFASWAKLKAHIGSVPARKMAEASSGAANSGQFVRYTDTARRAIFFARYRASQRQSPSIEPDHLLFGLVESDANLINRLAHDHSTCETIRKEIEELPATSVKATSPLKPLSTDSKRILQNAADEADRLHHERISTGHFLLGFMREDGSVATSILKDVLARKGLLPESIKEQIVRLMNEEAV